MAAVTVVTTTFKRPEYLKLALESLVAQTFSDFEVLICDNANETETAELVASFNDDRFRYIGRPENLGLVGNALAGFQAVESEFAVKLDDDDEFDERFLELAVGALRDNPSAVLSFGPLTYIGSHSEPLPKKQAQEDSFRGAIPHGYLRPFLDYVLNGGVQLNAAVIRTSAVDWHNLNIETASAYDLHVLIEAAGDATAAIYVPEATVRYRIHPDSDTSRRLASQLRGRIISIDHALASDKTYDHAMLERYRLEAAVSLTRDLVRTGEQKEAREVIRPALGSAVEPTVLRLALLTAIPNRIAGRISEWRLRRWKQSIPSDPTL
ncbi:MAG: glycosyltransferase [Propionibacteriaceae bacterium]|nr:glycosyltransferase [Propionibacteriaceae bacterium]